MKLFKNADVYAPEYLGKKDIFTEGGKIAHVGDIIHGHSGIPNLEIIDLKGKRLVPGYVDLHVHLTGGGGEQGPASRTPEAQLHELLDCGVTTAVGLLGTDGLSRSLENLLQKVRALTEEGITCYMLTGSYGYPPVTLTGGVERDMVLINEVIGVKTAVSDHRSSNPQGEELIRLAAETRRAGLLGSCCGIVTMHMGSGKEGMEPIFYALDHSDVPIGTFLPTHVNMRGKKLLDEAICFAKRGGTIDLTAGDDWEKSIELAKQVLYCRKQGAALERLTLSSDGYGSMPRFDETGRCIGLTYSTPKGLHQFVRAMTQEQGAELSDALMLVTKNPASVLNQGGVKGCIAPGADADMLVYDQNLEIESVIAKGQFAVRNGQHMLKSCFEE